MLGALNTLFGQGNYRTRAHTIDTRAGQDAIKRQQMMGRDAVASQGYSLAASGGASPLALREAQRRSAMAQQQLAQQGMIQSGQLEQQAAQFNAAQGQQAAQFNSQAQQRQDAAQLSAMGTVAAGALSDERAKVVEQENGKLRAMLAAQGQSSDPAGFAQLPSQVFRYRPEHQGEGGGGRQYSVPAQALEQASPMLAAAVQQGPDGMRRVDPAKLSMATAAQTAEQERRLQMIEAAQPQQEASWMRIMGSEKEQERAKERARKQNERKRRGRG